MNNHVKYGSVKTGDILLFSGWNIAAVILRIGTASEYTHAGIAVWLNTNEGPRLHCFEAGPCPLPDILSKGKLKMGCRLANVDLIMNYYNRLAVRKININRDERFYDTLRAFMKEYHSRDFRSMFRLALLNGGLVGPPRQGDGSIFCSELCSTWLARIGLLKEPILRSVPHHLSSPAFLSHDFVYPSNAFSGDTQIIDDENVEDIARTMISVTLIVSLLVYIAITVHYSKRD